MSEPMKIEMHFPKGHLGAFADEHPLITAVRLIAIAFGPDDGWCDKYGCDFENDVFYMRVDCQGCHDGEGTCVGCTGCAFYQEQNACIICADDSLNLEQRRAAPPELCCDYSAGRGIFAKFAPWTLDHSTHYYDPPNFWYKPADFRMTWYKNIGRDTATLGQPTEDMLERIFATHPKAMTIDDAWREFIERTEATQRAWASMINNLNTR